MIRGALELTVRTLLMAFGVAAVLWAFRVRAASARHKAWTAVLAVMLLLPLWNLWGPKIEAVQVPDTFREFTPQWVESSTASVANIRPSSALPAPAQPLDWERIAWISYLLVTAPMLARLAMGTALALRLRRRSREMDGFP